MIKSLSNIVDISVLDQDISDNLVSFTNIKFNDEPIGSGGFGTVHKVQSIDGKENSKYAIKIFTDDIHKQHAYDVIEKLHIKLKKHQLETSTPIYHNFPELLGLPFMAFKGYDNITEKHCVAFLMYNLNELDFKDYGEDNNGTSKIIDAQIKDKFYFAYQLSKITNFLHNIEFIHFDIKEASLWFNTKRVQLALIDYDSGYHFDTQEKPSTIGAIGQWISGKMRNIIGQKTANSNLTTEDRIYEEYWVLANAVFEIIFGTMPFFFLTDADDNTKKDYLNKFEWPDIDYSSECFNKANANQYNDFIEVLNQFESAGLGDLIKIFKDVFNKGYKNEKKRLSAQEWTNLLFSINQNLDNSPLIKEFSSIEKSINKKGGIVNFEFDAIKFNAIYINNELVPLNRRNYQLSLNDSKDVKLKAVNDFNTVIEVIKIKANKKNPIIINFSADKNLRDSTDPIKLSWNVSNASKVYISGFSEIFKAKDHIKVSPQNKINYTLKAIGYFDEEISQSIELDVIYPKITKFSWEVNLNEGIDNIDLFWETENTEKIEIIPNVNCSNKQGFVHVPIKEKTNFKLRAIGLFSTVEKELTAHPFPVPIVEQIFAQAPIIEMNANIAFREIQIPKDLYTIETIKFSNSITFNNLNLNSEELNKSLQFPQFTTENYLLNRYSQEKITISDILDRILKKINKKLKR